MIENLILVLLLMGLQTPSNIGRITIDTEAAKPKNLTEITSTLSHVPLSDTGFALGPIKEVYFINNKLYVMECKSLEESFDTRVLVFDKQGHYLNPLDSANGLTTWDVRRMSHDAQNKRIYTYCTNGYKEYDYKGNLIRWVEEKNVITVYDGLTWYQENETKAGRTEVRLSKSTGNKDNTETLKCFQYTLPQLYLNAKIYMYPPIWVEKKDASIYVASSMLNKIFVYHNSILEPKYLIDFKNKTAPTFADSMKTSFALIEDAILINYYRGKVSCDFIFSPQTGKHLNIKYKWNQQNNLISGVNDDILQTGLFRIRVSQGIPYFIKQTKDLKNSKIYKSHQVNPTVLYFSMD